MIAKYTVDIAGISANYPTDHPLGRMNTIVNAESDRGAVLVLAGFLDEQLTELLKVHLKKTKYAQELLSDKTGPLHTFHAKTLAVNAMGLLDDERTRDLSIIRGIRNDFAHKVEISFQTGSIKDRCMNFSTKWDNLSATISNRAAFPFQVSLKDILTPRFRFTSTALLIAVQLDSEMAERKR